MTQPKHRTRIEYSELDLVLYACPAGHFRFLKHPIADLPPVNLAPIRTPPPGRNIQREKRPRPESVSPKGADTKNARVTSPVAASSGSGFLHPDQAKLAGQEYSEHHLN